MTFEPLSSNASAPPRSGLFAGNFRVLGCRFFSRGEGTFFDINATTGPGALS